MSVNHLGPQHEYGLLMERSQGYAQQGFNYIKILIRARGT